MTVRAYKLKNPVTLCHAVRLSMGQRLVVVLTDPFHQEAQATVRSHFLAMEQTQVREDAIIYNFRNRFNLQNWGATSTYLGDIAIESRLSNSNLCVFQNACNTDGGKFLTVVNPSDQTIKIQPDTVIELVLFDKDTAAWEVCAKPSDLMSLEQIGFQAVSTKSCGGMVAHVVAPDIVYWAWPRCLDMGVRDVNCEYHYWLRYDSASIEQAQSMPDGTYDGGEVVCLPLGNDGLSPMKLKLKVLVRQDRMKDSYRSLLLPRYSPEPRKKIKRREPQKQKITLSPVEESSEYWGCRVEHHDCY